MSEDILDAREPQVVYEPSISTVVTTGWRKGPQPYMRSFHVRLEATYTMTDLIYESKDSWRMQMIAEDQLRKSMEAALKGPLRLQTEVIR
jgi:hypothetical protein